MSIRHAVPITLLAGCTGLSFGENGPGQDTPVDPPSGGEGEHVMGAIAVERDEDRLWMVHELTRDGIVFGHLSTIDPVTGVSTEVLDVSGTTDRRVMFPADDRMLLMAQNGGTEHLVLFDTDTLEPMVEAIKPTWYWGTRTSPSGDMLIVADNALDHAPLHLIDMATLDHRVVEHTGDTVEAMWNHADDRLLVVSTSDPYGQSPVTKIVRHDLRGNPSGWPIDISHTFAGLGWDVLFSFTWIGISPDDRWAVFPMRRAATNEGVLIILDQIADTVALADGLGPVGFTPDSRWIVSYGYTDDHAELSLIDPATLARRTLALPTIGGVSFHVMRESNHVVIVDAFDNRVAPIIYDVDADVARTVYGPALDLRDYVSRPGTDQLWLESAFHLYRLDISAATVTQVVPSMLADTVNVRPSADQMLFAMMRDPGVWRLDMATARIEGDRLALPDPTVEPARDTLFERAGIDPGATAEIARRAPRAATTPFDPAFDRSRSVAAGEGEITAWRRR